MISNTHERGGCKDIEVRRSEFVAKTLTFFQTTLFGKERHNFMVAGNHEYEETESKKFVILKSHPLRPCLSFETLSFL